MSEIQRGRQEAEKDMLRAMTPGAHMEAAIRAMSAVARDRDTEVLNAASATNHLLMAQLKTQGVRADSVELDAAQAQRQRDFDGLYR